jgi:hypothetical protein
VNYGAIRRLPDSNIMSYWSIIHLTKKVLGINPSAHKKFVPKAEIEPYAKGTFLLFVYLYSK